VPTLTELTKLLLAELSSVDDPANEAPGYAVMKAAGKWDGNASLAFVKAATTHGVLANSERRLVLAPIYSPGRVDAHNEHVNAQELEDAVMKFAESGDKTLHLMHDDFGADKTVGTIVACFTWPQDATVEMTQADGSVVKHLFPAGTAWAWCRFTKAAWPKVLDGTLGGLSMGGRALRSRTIVGGPTENMGFKIAANKNVTKAGRVLSAKNVEDLRACLVILSDLVAREPRAAEAAGVAKVRDGFVVADVEAQLAYLIAPDRIEVLGP
jgi:hypothetical protein